MLQTLLLLLMSPPGFANTVLFQSVQASKLEYKASLKAHPDSMSPSEAYVKLYPPVEAREALLTQFAAAQKDFLEKPDGEAAEEFRKIVARVPEEDWAASDREIFLYAYLRLAQMTGDQKKQDELLKQSLLLGEDVHLDETLYPPPLLERRLHLLAQSAKLALPLKVIRPGWTQVLINGRPCATTTCGVWPLVGGKVRVTYLSDQWEPYTAQLELKEIEKFKPSVRAWAKGHCGHADWGPAAAVFGTRKLFWSLDCEKPAAKETSLADLRPASAPPDLPFRFTEPTDDKPAPLYKNKWLWAGVGTVVVATAAILIVNSQKHNGTTETTTTYGD